MTENEVTELYYDTLDFSKGIERELDDSVNHNRFKVLQKHIRFQILNALVERHGDHGVDLKYFVLYNHHCEQQLSQRDIADELKKILAKLDEKEKIELIHEAINVVIEMLFASHIKDCRTRVDWILREKDEILERALEEDFQKQFLKGMKTFDQKTIANFVASFGLQMRGEDEKGCGKACKKKLSKCRTESNRNIWSDPELSLVMRLGMKRAWKKRRNENGVEDQED